MMFKNKFTFFFTGKVLDVHWTVLNLQVGLEERRTEMEREIGVHTFLRLKVIPGVQG